MTMINQQIPTFNTTAFHDEFKKLGVEIYAVSTDSHHVHKAWHDSSEAVGQTKLPMLGDPTGSITRGFGVMIEETGEAHRATFLIDPEGNVKVSEIHADKLGRSAKDFLRKVKAAQYVASCDGEVCPAAWEPDQYQPSAGRTTTVQTYWRQARTSKRARGINYIPRHRRNSSGNWRMIVRGSPPFKSWLNISSSNFPK